MKLTVDGLEKERDFYFGKLRDIEVLCQENEADDAPVLKQIMDILYATEVSRVLWCLYFIYALYLRGETVLKCNYHYYYFRDVSPSVQMRNVYVILRTS